MCLVPQLSPIQVRGSLQPAQTILSGSGTLTGELRPCSWCSFFAFFSAVCSAPTRNYIPITPSSFLDRFPLSPPSPDTPIPLSDRAHSMDTRLRPFRNLEPFEGYPIRDVAFSTTGDKILICSGSGAVKVRYAAASTQQPASRGIHLFDIRLPTSLCTT